MIFVVFSELGTDGPTDGRTDRPTDGRTDRPSYRDAFLTNASKNVVDHVKLLSF